MSQELNLCFEMDVDCEFVGESEQPCNWTMKYRSVIDFGKAFLLEDAQGKRRGLDIIVGHHSGAAHEYLYPEEVIGNIAVIKVEIDSLTGKQSGY